MEAATCGLEDVPVDFELDVAPVVAGPRCAWCRRAEADGVLAWLVAAGPPPVWAAAGASDAGVAR